MGISMWVGETCHMSRSASNLLPFQLELAGLIGVSILDWNLLKSKSLLYPLFQQKPFMATQEMLNEYLLYLPRLTNQGIAIDIHRALIDSIKSQERITWS